MKLIVGLGNPDAKYTLTRHNAGFIVLDEFAKSHELKWDEKKKFSAFTSETDINEGRVLLAKPTTYMNLSGEAVRKLVDFYNLKHQDVLVIQDDADIDFGKMRLVLGGNDGGHQGVASLYEHGLQDVWRLKVGVSNEDRHPGQAIDFVLRKFSEEEQAALPRLVNKATEVIDGFAHDQIEAQTFNY